MKRITPRTCLWPLTGVLCVTFALCIGLTYRSDYYCFAGTCGEWLFPLQARLHVVVWYMWVVLSVLVLALRAFQPSIRKLLSTSLGARMPLVGKDLRLSGVLLVLWVCTLYGILVSIWWIRLRDYFQERGVGLPGNNIVAAVALTGHLADVTTGMVLLPVSRHSALASFFKLSPSTTYTFHITQAYVLFGLIITHASLYASWAALYNQNRDLFRQVLPVLNPTYLYNEVWPGNTSALGTWRASLIFTGITASLIMMAMFFTSFPAIRRKHFNLFYFTHLSGIVAVVVICLHASTMFYCTIIGLSMWLLDWSMRVFELRKRVDSRIITLGNGCLSLPLPRKRLSGCACHSPLAHFYIHHSESSIREIHPFTTITHLASKKPLVTEEEDSISIQFLFRQSVPKTAPQALSQPPLKKSTQWTNKLASLADEEVGIPDTSSEAGSTQPRPTLDSRGFSEIIADYGVEVPLRLEGPYFTPANPEAFRTVICLVAGTGLSGAVAIAAAFCAHRARPRTGKKPATGISATGPVCAMADESSGYWDRCVVVWTVREKDFVDIPFLTALKCDGLEFRVHKTGGGQPRPDIGKELVEICKDEGDQSWCYISGPNGYIAAAEQACSQVRGLKWFAAKWE